MWKAGIGHSTKSRKSCQYILLLDLLAKEAESVRLEAQLVSEGTLSRYQRQRYRNDQGMLFSALETGCDARKLLTK